MRQKYHSFLEDNEKLADEEWFEEVDECVFTFKHRVYNWLKEARTKVQQEPKFMRLWRGKDQKLIKVESLEDPK